MSEIAQALHPRIDVDEHLVEEIGTVVLALGGQLAGQSGLHLHRDELLLGAVVEIPFELAAFLVLGGDESLAGGAELLDEAGVAQDEAGLRCDVVDEALRSGRHPLVRPHRYGDRTENLTVVLLPCDRRRG